MQFLPSVCGRMNRNWIDLVTTVDSMSLSLCPLNGEQAEKPKGLTKGGGCCCSGRQAPYPVSGSWRLPASFQLTRDSLRPGQPTVCGLADDSCANPGKPLSCEQSGQRGWGSYWKHDCNPLRHRPSTAAVETTYTSVPGTRSGWHLEMLCCNFSLSNSDAFTLATDVCSWDRHCAWRNWSRHPLGSDNHGSLCQLCP